MAGQHLNVLPKEKLMQDNVIKVSWEERRSKIRKCTTFDEKIRVSMQSMDQDDVYRKLEGLLTVVKAETKRAIYSGLLYVLQELTSKDEVSGRRKAVMTFKEGYELYCSGFGPQLASPDQRNFRDNLLSDNFGLPVVIFMWNNVNYIAISNSSGCDIVRLLLIFLNDEEEKERRFHLDAKSMKTIINSMETEYDKSVIRALVAATSSRSEIYDLGLKPQTAVSSLERIVNISTEVENALMAGKDMTRLALSEKIDKKKKELDCLKESHEKLSKTRADSRHLGSISEKITICNESVKGLQEVLEGSNPYAKQKFNAAATRRSQQLIEENRLRNRASGAGAKRKLDDIDEELIAKAIEQKTTVHGRRHDMVLYYHKRLKRDDLLSVANYHLLQRGKEMIKSATTVYNRAKPKRVGSLQARKHIGKGLFCSKKPPKTENSENILTHHQRKHVELAKLHLFSKAEDQKWAVDVSADDKAYIRPETSVGMQGTKHQSLLQPTEESGLEIRALPSHDFCDSRLYVTPSAYRIMSHEVKEINGKERSVLKDDESLVTVRPKYYIGSTGSVWASEHVYLRWNHPKLYEVEGSDYNHVLRTFCAMVRDTLWYFIDTTEKGDVLCVQNTVECPFRAYERHRLHKALSTIVDAQSKWNPGVDPG